MDKPVTLKLDEGIYHQARMAALQEKKNISAWITEAIKEKLNKKKGEK
uniref:Toxin-antitoxin system HicB family antitoxin n=1 Tax=viral metagenome TaxID=1070528 RepID=A0A6M3J5X1_9ZZZZ